MRRRWWIAITVVAALVVAVPVGFVASLAVRNAIGVVTVDGNRTLYWREFPGVAGIDAGAVLAGPTVGQAYRDGEAMVAEMRAAITAEFGMHWRGDPAGDKFEPFHPAVENGFGGRSMLTRINAPTSQSTSVPSSWEDKQRVIEIIGDIAAAHGYSAPVLDHEREYLTDEDRERDFGGDTPAEQVFVSGIVEGPVGQWIFFAMQDPSLDVDGRFEERLSNGDWERASVTLSYGANALMQEGDRDEFERRLEPFLGVPQPAPLED